MTHRQVDTDAGVPEGTTKNYFPTRDALLVAAAERHCQLYLADIARLQAAAAPADREGFIALLAQIMRRVREGARPGVDVFVEMHAEALRNPAVSNLLADMMYTDFGVTEELQRAAGLPVTPPLCEYSPAASTPPPSTCSPHPPKTWPVSASTTSTPSLANSSMWSIRHRPSRPRTDPTGREKPMLPRRADEAGSGSGQLRVARRPATRALG
ncbi:hypothetical protein [Nocardia gipuzkoensis]